MKGKVKTFKKDKEKNISKEIKTLKEIMFRKCKICFSEAALKPVLENRCSKTHSQNR